VYRNCTLPRSRIAARTRTAGARRGPWSAPRSPESLALSKPSRVEAGPVDALGDHQPDGSDRAGGVDGRERSDHLRGRAVAAGVDEVDFRERACEPSTLERVEDLLQHGQRDAGKPQRDRHGRFEKNASSAGCVITAEDRRRTVPSRLRLRIRERRPQARVRNRRRQKSPSDVPRYVPAAMAAPGAIPDNAALVLFPDRDAVQPRGCRAVHVADGFDQGGKAGSVAHGRGANKAEQSTQSFIARLVPACSSSKRPTVALNIGSACP
jgi:hypothetical protein